MAPAPSHRPARSPVPLHRQGHPCDCVVAHACNVLPPTDRPAALCPAGDVDGDKDLDLVVGNTANPGKLFFFRRDVDGNGAVTWTLVPDADSPLDGIRDFGIKENKWKQGGNCCSTVPAMADVDGDGPCECAPRKELIRGCTRRATVGCARCVLSGRRRRPRRWH